METRGCRFTRRGTTREPLQHVMTAVPKTFARPCRQLDGYERVKAVALQRLQRFCIISLNSPAAVLEACSMQFCVSPQLDAYERVK